MCLRCWCGRSGSLLRRGEFFLFCSVALFTSRREVWEGRERDRVALSTSIFCVDDVIVASTMRRSSSYHLDCFHVLSKIPQLRPRLVCIAYRGAIAQYLISFDSLQILDTQHVLLAPSSSAKPTAQNHPTRIIRLTGLP